MPRDPGLLTRVLLQRAVDEVRPLVVWDDRATYLVTTGKQRFVVKTDDDHLTVGREIAGHRRAAAAGVRVPELVASVEDAFAMRWVAGVPLQQRPTPAAWRDAGSQIRIAHDLGGGPPFGTGFGGFNPTQPSWRGFFELFAETMLSGCEHDLGFPADAAARIRVALRAAAPMLDTPNVGWCHGDLQPDHVLIDPETDRVAAIIDWADHGSGDFGWDVAVLTIDHESHLPDFLEGYGATEERRAALRSLLPLYYVVRLLGEAGWFAEHGLPYAENLRRAIETPLSLIGRPTVG